MVIRVEINGNAPAPKYYTYKDNPGYYCTLKFMEYQRPDAFSNSTFTTTSMCYLPLPNELQDGTHVDYQTTDLGVIGDLVSLTDGGGGLNAAASGATRAAGGAINGLINAVTNTVGANVNVADQIDTVFQQSMKIAPNPNQTVAFKGPVLRDHQFSWVFQPHNEGQSNNIKKLIKELKRRSLPEPSFASSNSLLKYPHMCQINFYPWDNSGTNEWGWGKDAIIKIKKCMISSVNVNYSPAGSPGFFHTDNNDGHPVAIRLDLTLKEIEYMLSEDWDGTDQGQDLTGNDLYNSIGEARGNLKNSVSNILNSVQ